MEFANNHAVLRAWAIEGTGGHGAGLSRHLVEMTEIVIELDRGWAPRATVANAKHCRCFWLLALRDQRLHRGPAAGLQPGLRST